ncbi:Oligopeptide-binding protein AppA [Koleobacter methoxysyntrophicus]|uniref:Oligopeptide-binding protein AppA n=1 Tax=Koleobacter methoxysyntrophicus TaxID=2751313 RepID=A0A8A0RQS7_9FIRM|nr:ABC transporter substrate-binding protein [Koleobacter methoxysyntrophicus]QSQ09556.1 Oligopeptide-binding protein AppA [Koleobacter methoxysyntrophicus]
MLKYRIITIISILFAALILVISGCSDNNVIEEPEENIEINPVNGGNLVIGIDGNVETLNPILATGEGERQISGFIFRGLVKSGEDLRNIPELAESWEISPDGLEWTFLLKDSARWHDGTPVTSQDVVFTFDRIFDPRLNSPLRENFQNIASYKAVDDKTVIFELFQPDAFFLNDLTVGIIPAHIFKEEDFTVEAYKNLTIGNGPFKIKNWDKTLKTLTLEKNHDYFGKVPYLDEVIFKTFPDSEAQKSAFKAGEIDTVEISIDDWPLYQQMKNVKTYQFPRMYYEFIGLNLKKNHFQDFKIRQALIYAINRGKIVGEVLLNKGRTVNSPIPDHSWAFNSNLERYQYNPQKALNLLKEAGWEISEDRILYKETGTGKREKFEFTLIVNEENKMRYRVAELIKQDLEQIGIHMKILVKPWDEVLKHIRRRDFEAVFAAWELDTVPDMQFAFHSNEISGGYNFVSYINQEFDKIVVELRRTTDTKKRQELLLKSQEIINRDLPYIFLYSKDRLLAVRSKFKGVFPNPNGFYWNIEEWWVPEEFQKKGDK